MSDLVAGGAAAGHGLLVGCAGSGELTRSMLTDVLTVANAKLDDERQMPRDWLPGGKQLRVHLSRAMAHAARGLYDVERVARRAGADGQLPLWTARMLLVTKPAGADGRVGEQYPGRVVLECELYEGDGTTPPVLRFPNSDIPGPGFSYASRLEETVREDFADRVGRERFASADITVWFGRVLHDKLGAVRYGGNWYVPAGSKDRAVALYTTLMEAGWGTSWVHPALPVATSAELSAGLAISLQAEVADITKRLMYDRELARREGKPDIGPRAAANYAAQYNAVAAKSDEWLHLIGAQGRDDTLAHVADALVVMDEIMANQPTEPNDTAEMGVVSDQDVPGAVVG